KFLDRSNFSAVDEVSYIIELSQELSHPPHRSRAVPPLGLNQQKRPIQFNRSGSSFNHLCFVTFHVDLHETNVLVIQIIDAHKPQRNLQPPLCSAVGTKTRHGPAFQ